MGLLDGLGLGRQKKEERRGDPQTAESRSAPESRPATRAPAHGPDSMLGDVSASGMEVKEIDCPNGLPSIFGPLAQREAASNDFADTLSLAALDALSGRA